ncbi:toll-like receptor Tollo [Gigantopelta aegis]|uniref:toll-like receptor Tollo n=1 Tax=Gigantopelta aegis TaxID=1735272 RepID=UPI001B88AD3E|nr:toll-like receptor Tollo [Gigantopelta aegis]
MDVSQRQTLDVLAIILLIIMVFKPTLGQDTAVVRFACEYPTCKCRQLTETHVSFIMECTTSWSDAVILPRNQSTNIVQLSVQCSENANPLTLLERLRYDLLYVRSLTLENCETALNDIVAAGKFHNLVNLTLKGARADLSDADTLNAGLASLGELTFLNILNSSIKEMPSLCSQTELVSLNVSGNVLSSVGSPYQKCTSSTKQTKLRVLDLSRNKVTRLESWLGQGTSLTDLHLSSNLFDENDFAVLVNLSDLTSLDMSNNLLTALPVGSFTHNLGLRRLNVSRNSITVLQSGSITGPSRLESLDLSHNSLSVIQDGALAELRHLKRLYLGFNSLSSLPFSIFDQLASLKILHVMNNSIVDVPSFSHLQSLLALNLKNNQIQRLQRDAFSSLTLLQAIGLSGNALTTMELATFDFSESLFIIDLSYNNISSLVDGVNSRRTLSKIAKVSYLRLDFNKIDDISIIGKRFLNLKYLFLDNNHVTTIRKRNLPRLLKILTLSDNNITRIAAMTFKFMKNLELVTLQRNYPYLSQLRWSSVQVYSKQESKPKFYIGGNLFMCDCNMAYLKAWNQARNRIPALKLNYPNFSDMQDVYCISLYDKEATSFREVPMSHFVCEYMFGRHCPFGCKCCLKPNCTCDYTCPVQCSCYQGGTLWTNDVYDRIHCDNRLLTEVPENIPLSATHLYLNDNEMLSLTSGRFSGLSEVRHLYLNNSGVTHIGHGVFSGMDKLEGLFLNHNMIFELLNGSFNGLRKLKELHLENNRISYIEENTFSMLINLKFLSLENNLLTTLSAGVFSSPGIAPTIMLLGNPWSCECQSMVTLKEFMKQHGSLVERASDLRCYWLSTDTSNESGHLQNYTEDYDLHINQAGSIPVLQYEYDSICSNTATVNVSVQHVVFLNDGKYVAALVILIIIIVVSLATSALAYWKRKELQAWIFVRFGLRIVNKNKNINEAGRKYDAFVSYSSKDEHVVVHELAPKLEGGENPYRLCLHYRDFPVGDCIADTIINSIEASKRTLMLISENFLTSEWCRYEFQTAHHHILKENTHRLIMVLLEDLDLEKVDPDLRVHLKIGNFLKYNDPWFWEKLYFALPDRQVDKVDHNVVIVDGNIGGVGDDDDDVFYTEAQINDVNLAKERLRDEHRV